MVSAQDVRWKQDLTACTKGRSLFRLRIRLSTFFISGAATTASRLGQPDLAIATLNDFVEVAFFIQTWTSRTN